MLEVKYSNSLEVLAIWAKLQLDSTCVVDNTAPPCIIHSKFVAIGIPFK
jgi:hypothetical protein